MDRARNCKRSADSGCWSRRASARCRRGRARPPISPTSAGSAPCGGWSAARCTSSTPAAALPQAELRELGALLHDRMTESLWIGHARAGPVSRRGARGRCAWWRSVRDGHAALARANAELGPRAVERGDRLSGRGVRHARARSHRCRAHDVRAGQFRALPAQDLQRASSSIDGEPERDVAVRHDSRDSCGELRGRAVRLSRQRRGDRRFRAARGSFPIPATRRYGGVDEPRRHPDEGGDAQPSDGDLALSRRRHRLGRRDSRRGRDRHRRQTQGGVDGILGVESAHPRHGAAVGSGFRQTRPDRLRARHHDRRSLGGGGLQQRVRPTRHLRLFPHLRAGRRAVGAARSASCAAITSPS